jgi:hypothetical protein
MSGLTHRRLPARLVPLAALVAALVLCGLAAGRTADPAAGALHAALTATQTAAHDGAHWAVSRPARGKAGATLATASSSLVAPGLTVAVTASAALLVVAAFATRPRRRRVGRMHAGRGPPRQRRQPARAATR